MDPRLGAAVAAGNLRPLAARIDNVNLESRDAGGTTPLIRAARAGDVATLRGLMAYGAELNGCDRHYRTALDYAVERSSEAAVKALLAGGASPDIGDRNADTALHLAARGSNVAIVRDLLAAGADVTIVNARHQTPLEVARNSSSPSANDIALALARAAHQ